MPKLIYTGPSPHSGHRIDKYIRCPQLWAYSVMEPSPLPARTESPALIKGSLGHVGLAHHYRRLQALQEGEDPSQWWEPLRAVEERAVTEGASWLRYVTEVQHAVSEYLLHYGEQRVEVLGVEATYAMEVAWTGRTWPVTRSADLVVRAPGGAVRIVDHKFVGRLNDRTVSRYRLDGQFLDYALIGAREWGAAFDGAFLNLIEWPSKAGATPKMKQLQAPSAPAAVESRKAQLVYTHAQRSKIERAGVDLWNYPKRLNEQVCNGPYGLCAGADLCAWGKVAATNLPD